VGRSRIHKDLRTISGRVSEVRKSERVRIQKSGCVESKGFHTREFNAILRSCGVCRTAQSWRKPRWILDSPWQCVQRCHKRGRVCDQDGAVTPGELAFCLSWVLRKVRSGWLLLFGSEPLPWVEPVLLFFYLNWEEPLRTCYLTWRSWTSVQNCFWRFWKYGFCGKLPHIIPSIVHQ